MPFLTGVILAAFVAYAAAWYRGLVEGNFALLLFVATVVTGVYWVAERLYFLPQRKKAVATLEQTEASRQAQLQAQGITQLDNKDLEQAKTRLLMQPWWLDWTAGLFPVIVVVFVLRSFLFEPFKIPSGSMIPTLWIGDLILVNKYHYGVRLPVIHTKITEGQAPQRGDVMVFRYPPNPNLDYIKRVIGVPGDTVAYINKRLTINNQVVATQDVENFLDPDTMEYFDQHEETLAAHQHRLITRRTEGPGVFPERLGAEFKRHPACHYSVEGITCTVPPGQYFVMGDNRDNSTDSRYWGFVPEENIVGKAFFVWLNFGNLKRFGSID